MALKIKELKKICQPEKLVAKDNFYIRTIIRKISIYFTWLSLHTPITANQLTLVHTIFGIAGGFLLIFGNYWYSLVGVLCIQIHVILDCTDGEVARFKKSDGCLLGGFMDRLGHNIIHSVLFISLTFGVYSRYDQSIFVFYAGFLALAGYFIVTNYHAMFITSLIEAVKPNKKGLITIEAPGFRAFKKGYLNHKNRLFRYAVSFFTGLVYFRMREVLFLAAVFDKLNWMLYLYGAVLPFLLMAIIFFDWINKKFTQ